MIYHCQRQEVLLPPFWLPDPASCSRLLRILHRTLTPTLTLARSKERVRINKRDVNKNLIKQFETIQEWCTEKGILLSKREFGTVVQNLVKMESARCLVVVIKKFDRRLCVLLSLQHIRLITSKNMLMPTKY